MKRDASLLWEDLDRSDVPHRIHNRVKERANSRRLSDKVMLDVVASARVRLVAIRELPAAPLAAPHPAMVRYTPISNEGLPRERWNTTR